MGICGESMEDADLELNKLEAAMKKMAEEAQNQYKDGQKRHTKTSKEVDNRSVPFVNFFGR